MNLKLKRTPGIYLVGFMGCGKSTIGRLYADEIGWRFADSDDDIEASQKTTISDLFSKFGEEEFRKIESSVIHKRIQSVRRGMPLVMSLGGGAFTREENIELLHENGITVWINTDFEVMHHRVAAHDHRPLARDPKRFRELYEQRLSWYRRAEFHVDIPDGNSKAGLKQLVDLCLLD